jgi:antitoxin CcdA
MIKYKKKIKSYEALALESITCDVCGKEFFQPDYMEYNDDLIEIQEMTNIELSCGYGSIFGDGNTITLDICQHCLKEKLGNYLQLKVKYESEDK